MLQAVECQLQCTADSFRAVFEQVSLQGDVGGYGETDILPMRMMIVVVSGGDSYAGLCHDGGNHDGL